MPFPAESAQGFPLIGQRDARQEFAMTTGVETPRIPALLFRPFDLRPRGLRAAEGHPISFEDRLVLPRLREFRVFLSPFPLDIALRLRAARDETIKVIPYPRLGNYFERLQPFSDTHLARRTLPTITDSFG